jgi:hypothetical protein
MLFGTGTRERGARWIDESRCTCRSSKAQKMMGDRAGRSGAVGWRRLMEGADPTKENVADDG